MSPGPGNRKIPISVSEFVNRVTEGQVNEVVIAVNDVYVRLQNGTPYFTVILVNFPDIYKVLSEKSVRWEYKESSAGGWLSIVLNASLPILLLVGFWIFMARQMQSGGNKALSFGKSRARLHSQQRKVTFKDV